MSGPEPRKNAGASRWAVLFALLAGLGLGVGVATLRGREGWTERDAAVRAAEAAEARRDAALIEAKEARIVFIALARENASWREKVEGLTDRLAATDPGLPRAGAPTDVSLAAVAKARVVEAREDLEYVVLDVGSLAGIRPGMRLNVLRDETWIARLRALDVKDELTGASVEETEAGVFPQAGDRIVLGTDNGA